MRIDVTYFDGRGNQQEGEGTAFGRRFLAAYGDFREALGVLRAGGFLAPDQKPDEISRHARNQILGVLNLRKEAGEIHDFQVLMAETSMGGIALTVDIWPQEETRTHGRATAWVRGGPPVLPGEKCETCGGSGKIHEGHNASCRCIHVEGPCPDCVGWDGGEDV